MTNKIEIMREQLYGLSISDKISLIANLLVLEGFEEIGVPPDTRSVDKHNVFHIVMKDRTTNGETIGNSMALQGLIMLDWIAQLKE
jgi:hypothetical protein